MSYGCPHGIPDFGQSSRYFWAMRVSVLMAYLRRHQAIVLLVFCVLLVIILCCLAADIMIEHLDRHGNQGLQLRNGQTSFIFHD